MRRAELSESTFAEAVLVGREHGITLTNPSDGCYQMRHASGWIINLYPRRSGATPRMCHDPKHRGPYLHLPTTWTLLDAVRAAVEAVCRPEDRP